MVYEKEDLILRHYKWVEDIDENQPFDFDNGYEILYMINRLAKNLFTAEKVELLLSYYTPIEKQDRAEIYNWLVSELGVCIS